MGHGPTVGGAQSSDAVTLRGGVGRQSSYHPPPPHLTLRGTVSPKPLNHSGGGAVIHPPPEWATP